MRTSYNRSYIYEDVSIPIVFAWEELIASVLVLVPALFNDILPYGMRNTMLLAGCAMVMCLFLRHKDFDLTRIGIGYGWLMFAIVVICARFVGGGELRFAQMAFPIISFISCMATSSTSWLKVVFGCAVVLLSIHLMATLVFYVAPDLYLQTIKTRFFLEDVNAVGYQSGLTAHFSNNGFIMATGFLLTACLALNAKGRARRWWIALAVLFFLGLALTQKRAHLVFGIAAFALLFIVTGKRGKVFRVCAFAIGITTAFVVAIHMIPGVALSFERLTSTLESGDINEITTGRTFLWEEAIRGWREHPMFGNGWGSYVYVWPGGNTSIYAHNEILQMLHDTGIVGTGLFLCLAIGSFGLAVRNLKDMKRAAGTNHTYEMRAACFALSFEFFCLVYSCTTGTLLQQPLVFIPYLMSVGMSTAIRSRLSDERSVQRVGTEVRYA